MDIAADQLLRTKLHGPRCERDLVTRPRSIEWLNQGLRCKADTGMPPSGYGKNTLLADWTNAFRVKE